MTNQESSHGLISSAGEIRVVVVDRGLSALRSRCELATEATTGSPEYRCAMKFGGSAFGWVEIDGTKYEHDVVIDHGRIHKRKKGPSKSLRERYGHTALSLSEEIPWNCERLVIGTGAAGPPSMALVKTSNS